MAPVRGRGLFGAAVAIAAAILPFPRASGANPGLLIALSSYREDLGYPRIYFFQHDGVGTVRPLGGIPPGTTRSDHRPALTADGRFCATTQEVVAKTSQIALWDCEQRQIVPLPNLTGPSADLGPSFSSDGRWLAFSSWRRPGPAGWNVFLYDRTEARVEEPRGLNSDADDRMPNLSGDGRYLAFASSRPTSPPGEGGLSDIYVYDRQSHALLPPETMPGLNSPAREVEPAFSEDGRYVTFVSDRPGGEGHLDVYFYDRQARKLVPLPGLNSPAPEQSPAITADGRYVAFVSERLEGAGHRDVYLYDRAAGKLLPVPGLNTSRDDVDPAIRRAKVD
jgi:dipeptidyl aminopeptidase/acylaminoacyl peptidase